MQQTSAHFSTLQHTSAYSSAVNILWPLISQISINSGRNIYFFRFILTATVIFYPLINLESNGYFETNSKYDGIYEKEDPGM